MIYKWADYHGDDNCYQCEDTPAMVILDWGDRTEILCVPCWKYVLRSDLSGHSLDFTFELQEYDNRVEEVECV